MPIGFVYNEAENILFIRSAEHLCLQDYLIYRNHLGGLPFRDGLRCLANYLDTSVSMNYEEMLFTVKKTREVFQNVREVRVAICVESALAFGLARMYSLLNENDDYRVQVVQSLPEALQLLEIESTLLPASYDMLNSEDSSQGGNGG